MMLRVGRQPSFFSFLVRAVMIHQMLSMVTDSVPAGEKKKNGKSHEKGRKAGRKKVVENSEEMLIPSRTPRCPVFCLLNKAPDK
jgi:hypothetical protein